MSKIKNWTDQEIEILKSQYSFKDKEEVLHKLPGRTWEAIKLKARKFDLRPEITPDKLLSRFLRKINKNSKIFGRDGKSEHECWIWLGAYTRGNLGNYGLFWNGKNRIYAHRWAHEYFIGPIPAGYEVDHLCKNPNCVNPDHLEAVTRRENWLRAGSIGAINALKTHCKRGHEFTPENTYYIKSGGRMCRICKLMNERIWHKKKRLKI